MVGALTDWISRLTLSEIGSYASVLGAAVTVWVLWDVRRIRAIYLATARVPELAKRLRKHASTLSDLLNNPTVNAQKIAAELATAHATAASLASKLFGQHRKSAKALLRLLRVDKPSTEAIRDIYVAMLRLSEDLKNLQADLKWEH